jgi:hypothetical protein
MSIGLSTGAKSKDDVFKFEQGISVEKGVDPQSGADEITFFKDSKKTSCVFVGEVGKSFFHDVEKMKIDGYAHPLFVSDWSLGVHGEKLIVFDPSAQKCVLKNFESGHPLDFGAEGDHLKIIYSTYNSRQEKVGEKIETWKPKEYLESNP